MFPDTLDNAKVLYFTPRGDYGIRTLTDGNEWFRVCYLAICKYGNSQEYYLFECNEDYGVESDYSCDSAEECMELGKSLCGCGIDWLNH